MEPDFAEAHSNLIYTQMFAPDSTAQTIYDAHRRWNMCHAAPLAKCIQSHLNDPDPDRPLRVGYASPDFRSHPVGRFLLPLLQAHDRQSVRIYCYAWVPVPDALTEQCHAQADVWRNVLGTSDEQFAALIRQDQIDILVDLTMHMADNRLLVFARKPAPVQVTYLAYCGTTGLSAMDYRLTDIYMDPPGQADEFYTERSVRLPESYWCYQSVPQAPSVNGLPVAKTGHITFGCLNNFCKVTLPALATWCEVMRAVPRSKLVLHAHPGRHRQRIADFFLQQQIAPDRVMFVKQLPMVDYFALYHQIDMALDPFPYCGGTTTCDALWMGVPVVSLAGQTAVGRGGLSILSIVGLPELAARDVGHYVRIAVDLANDPDRLQALRSSLRERVRTSPLMDAPRFARNIEIAYRDMWKRWCDKAGQGYHD
jgi:predicted O-linked N-acetylglucosamine transferase (SPINDLY family)